MAGAACKVFPPGMGHLRVPLSSRRAALSAIALYAACRPRALWAQRAAVAWVRLLGPRALPGRTTRWTPPVPPEVWAELAGRWRGEAGAFDGVAVHERAQPSRTGCALLLLQGGAPLAFVRLRPGEGGGLVREGEVLERVRAFGPRTFTAPEPLGVGEAAGWHYLVTTPLAPGLHRPADDPPLAEIAEEVGGALRDLPRPHGTPEHWRPMHGDLTPWNLRRLRGGGLALYDWEEAEWAPPGADEVLYRAASAALGRRTPGARRGGEEAVRFWEGRVSRNAHAEGRRDRALAAALLAALREA